MSPCYIYLNNHLFNQILLNIIEEKNYYKLINKDINIIKYNVLLLTN